MQGQTINGYTLKHRLGEGGMAEVWYAENEIGKPAAVKILNENLSRKAQIVERFHNEALVMVKLDHPNIRQVYGYGYLGDRHCIIMEYLDGDDLEAMLKSGRRFNDEELRRWWNQTVDALNYTHSMGIVHRDIKPSNLFLDKKGNIKLLDFGIAKVKESMSMTRTGMAMGTLMYMSPEQVKDPKRVEAKSDIYSLAVTFVHLLSGKPIYDCETNSEFDIQLSIVSDPVDLSSVPAGWQGFLAPYLEKDPQKRPALRAFEAVQPKEEPTTKVVEDPSKKAKQKEQPVATVVAPQPKESAIASKPEKPADKPLSLESVTRVQPKQPVAEKQPAEQNDKPKSKNGLWIGIGVAAAVAALLIYFLRPKEEPITIDPDTRAFQACYSVEDLRTYMRDYGRNGLHYNEAKALVDKYVADSIEQARQAIAAQQALAETQAQQQAEAEAQAKAEAEAEAEAEAKAQTQAEKEKQEDAAFKKCTTVAGCNAYLKAYPNGRYVDDVTSKKIELQELASMAAENQAYIEAMEAENAAYEKCTTVAACDYYLRTYPNGFYIDQVKAKKKELETKDKEQKAEADQRAKTEAEQKAKAAKEKEAYDKCTTIAACNAYLKSYPEGKYAGEVKRKKLRMESEALEDEKAEMAESGKGKEEKTRIIDDYRISYRVHPDPLIAGKDGNVVFDVVITIPGECFDKRAAMNLKVYLSYNGNPGRINLPPITIIGEKVNANNGYDFRVNYNNGGEFTKKYSIPYQDEMGISELKIEPISYKYDGTIYRTHGEIMKNARYSRGRVKKVADGTIVK